MRRLVLVAGVFFVLVLAVFYYPGRVEKPEKDGTGALAVWIDPQYAAPEYHSPLDWWQTHHTEVVNRGDLERADCLYCHEPERSCNNCHGYVGADQILDE